MLHPQLESGLTVLAFSRRNLLGLAEDIPADKLCHQPAPGLNHALWVLGHLAWTDEFFLGGLGGVKPNLGEQWGKRFGMKSTPTPNLRDYPPLAEVKDALSDCRERLRSWFQSLDEKQLLSPLPSEFMGFAPNHVGLMYSLAWHEGLHTGQLTACRRSLGLAPKFG